MKEHTQQGHKSYHASERLFFGFTDGGIQTVAVRTGVAHA